LKKAMTRLAFILTLAGAGRCLRAARGSPARAKLEAIEKKTVPSGQTVRFTSGELLDYAREELVRKQVRGVRTSSFQLGMNQAEGSAWIEFNQVSESVVGRPPGMLSRLLLRGERQVDVAVRVSSQDGWCRVDLLSVEVDGWNLEGRALDWVIANYVLPRYPNAKINNWFQLESNIRRVSVTPAAVAVQIL